MGLTEVTESISNTGYDITARGSGSDIEIKGETGVRGETGLRGETGVSGGAETGMGDYKYLEGRDSPNTSKVSIDWRLGFESAIALRKYHLCPECIRKIAKSAEERNMSMYELFRKNYGKQSNGPAEALAMRFHDIYEKLAPAHDPKTRRASAVPWKEVPENNRLLMTHVCQRLLQEKPWKALEGDL